ncbi:MAG TPA: hypothetical protein V6D27_00950 [Vampirovibrionales bacterium]
MSEIRGIKDLIRYYCDLDRASGVTYDEWCELAAAAVRGMANQRMGHTGLMVPGIPRPAELKEWTLLQNCRGSIDDYVELARFAINRAYFSRTIPQPQHEIGEEPTTESAAQTKPVGYQSVSNIDIAYAMSKLNTLDAYFSMVPRPQHEIGEEIETDAVGHLPPSSDSDLIYRGVTDIDIAYAMSKLNTLDSILQKSPIEVICGATGTPWIVLKFEDQTFWADKTKSGWSLRLAKDHPNSTSQYRENVVKRSLQSAIVIAKKNQTKTGANL